MAVDLRPITPGDGEALHAILRHLQVAAWLRPAGRSDAFAPDECAMLAARHAAHWVAHGFGIWIAYDDGRPVARGGSQHTVVGGRSEVELAWAVVPDRWGEGLAGVLARAGLALTDERGVEGVVAFTRPDNVASRRVMEKAGLVYEREVAHAGLDHVLFRRPASAPAAPSPPPSTAAR